MRELMTACGYLQFHVSIVERANLYARCIGGVTDIVEKGQYTFEGRNADSLSLGSEFAASCLRAGIRHGLIRTRTPRLWYRGPMFRHECSLKGRYPTAMARFI